MSRFLDAPIGTPNLDAVLPGTDSFLLDKRATINDKMVEDAKGVGKLLSF